MSSGARLRLFIAVAALGMAAPPVAAADIFLTPSRNISCATGVNIGGGSGILCTVFSEANQRGQKLWRMHRTGGVRVFRQASNAPSEGRVLGYGKSFSGGGVHCFSGKSGLTCRNRSRHGFFLSRTKQRVF